MAFRGKRKDVKKQSYYVWFLGAKESKGLRGDEYIRPVLRYLLDKEKELEPMKVTLQVSNKGMKIIQNVPRKNNKGKTEQIKHFIPHHAITCVLQESKPDDDIVCCILLIYNPLTKCPVHVHAYRCDSVETATTLRSQLQILIERAENQKKFREIENRLAAKGLLPPRRLNSDGRSTRTDDSDRTEDSFGSERDMPVTPRRENIASLYDSLAAELRERLTNKNNCPILLPPKDYDTMSRRQGKLDGIDKRRSTHLSIVGLNPTPKIVPPKNEKSRESGSSGKSSGIGSDEALSSAIQEVASHPDFETKEIDPDTSSDEEDWPQSEPLPVDDEVVQTEWRKAPPAGGPNRYRPPSPTHHHSQAPPPIHPPGYHERNGYYSGRSPAIQEFDRSPPVKEFRQMSLQRSKTMERDEEPKSFDYRYAQPDSHRPNHVRSHSRGYRDETPIDKSKTPDREPEVVYRRRSNPLERKSTRESRPVSYPGNHPSVQQAEPEPPIGPPTFQYGYPVPDSRGPYETRPDTRPEPRGEPRNNEPRSFGNGYQVRSANNRQPDKVIPRHDPNYHGYDSVPAYSYDRYRDGEGHYKAGYAPDNHHARRPEHQPERGQPYYVEERRKSGYFDLPVDSRDYRHSFAEPQHRRLQLGAQY